MPPNKRRSIAQLPKPSHEYESLEDKFESPVKCANIAVVIYTPSKTQQATLGALPTPQNSSQYDAADQGLEDTIIEITQLSSSILICLSLESPSAVPVIEATAASDTDSDIQILPSPRGRVLQAKESRTRKASVTDNPLKQRMRDVKSRSPKEHVAQHRPSGTDQQLGYDLSRVPAGANFNGTLHGQESSGHAMSILEGMDTSKVIDLSSDNISDSELSIFASPPRSSRKIFTGDIIAPKQDKPAKQDPGSTRRFLPGGNTGNAPVSTTNTRVPPKLTKPASTRIPTRPQQKAGFNTRHTYTPTDEGDSDEITISPVKRQKRQGGSRRPVAHATVEIAHDQDEEDLEEVLEVLQDTNPKARRTRARITPAKKGKAQKQLEILKRRRAGEKITNISSSSDEARNPKRGIYDTDSDELSLPDEQSDDDSLTSREDPSGIEAIRETLRSDRRDQYDADFVDDDEEGTIGAPLGLEDIPIGFTRHAHKELVEHFKDAIEWMVHNKLNPAFARQDPLYRTAFRRLDDEVKGFTASKFVSAAWNPKFIRALQSRPIFYEMELPVAEGNKCDACNRSGHPAKYQVQFGGKSYHRENLEDVSEASDDESDQDDAKSRDSQGRSIPDSETPYFVGRFCKANAETAHSLIHWRYHLNQWVIDHLKEENHFGPEKVIEREGWAVKRRQKYANGVVDAMEDAGEIRSLFRDFKTNLDAARNAKPSRYRER
ncbi:MAG: hypothetical protein M1835_006565 [Candelina submexicana]|nr:MAG: hypothetical protein M1835_006565 [Candelina submexicana]